MGVGCGNYLMSALAQTALASLPISVVFSNQSDGEAIQDEWELSELEKAFISLPNESYFPRLGQAIWEGLNHSVKTAQIIDGYNKMTGLISNASSGACCPFVFEPKSRTESAVFIRPLVDSSPVTLSLIWREEAVVSDVATILDWLDSSGWQV